MDRAQQDETLRMRTKRGKSRCVAPLRVLSYQATLVVKACHRLGGKKEKRWGGLSKTRHFECGQRGESHAASLLGVCSVLSYQATLVV